ncbi:MAG: translation initiation factor IF-2 N-terminal domain-containing protein, partial [Nitrospirota bacterium]|nr:translation initiation factor IF-2 N-terminal domain-containing protein [Nitrospirota bacterium]
MRIYELSKKIKADNKEILAKLAELGIPAKSHMSNIDDATVNKLMDIYVNKKKPAAAPQKPKEPVKPAAPKEQKKSVPGIKINELNLPVAATPLTPASKEAPVEGEEEDVVVVPEKFKKELEAEKLAKFKAKPGMQRAFDSIRRVEVSKKGFDFNKPKFKKQDKRAVPGRPEEAEAPVITQPRKRVLKFREGSTVKEFAELIGQKINDVIKKFMELGYMTTINQPLDADAAQIVADSFDIKI